MLKSYSLLSLTPTKFVFLYKKCSSRVFSEISCENEYLPKSKSSISINRDVKFLKILDDTRVPSFLSFRKKIPSV